MYVRKKKLYMVSQWVQSGIEDQPGFWDSVEDSTKSSGEDLGTLSEHSASSASVKA